MEEIVRFLQEHPPFSLLTMEQIQSLARHVQIEYFAAETDVLRYGGPVSEYVYVIRRGSVDLLRATADGSETFDTFGEGDLFGYLSIVYERSPLVTVRTREETLAYLIPAQTFNRVRRDAPPLEQFVTASKSERLNAALSGHHAQPEPYVSSDLFRLRLRDLSQPALLVEPYTSIRRAAELMRERDATSVVVTTHPLGIVSDRDLRNRVLATGMPDSAHIVRVMTSPVLTLPVDSLAFEALMLMVERNIHHVPIIEGGTIVGIVTHNELLRQQSRSPLLLPRLLERAKTIADLRSYSDMVETTAIGLLLSGARINDIGRMVAIAHDALLERIIADVERELGKPPCPYAWLVLGSEGRYERIVRTDQDNALVYADDAPQWAQVYFADLAEQVVERLVQCGHPRCPGNVMATNPQWRQPLATWQDYFSRWINRPDEESLLKAGIFFDFRKVYGTLDVEADLRPLVLQGQNQQIFLARMMRAALRQSPPLGFFRNFVLEKSGEHKDLVDMKLRGVSIVVDMARVYGIGAGSAATNTIARLRDAAARGTLSEPGAEELIVAFELISLFRLRYQRQQVDAGEPVSNLVPMSFFSRLEQRDLKDAFRAIADVQKGAEHTFQTSVLG